MNREISFATMWQVLKNGWKMILIITLVAMLIMGLITGLVLKKEYSSSIRFYVINVNTTQDFEQSALVTVKEQLSKEYIQIILSDVMINPLAEKLKTEYGLDYTPNQIKKMISASTLTDIGMFDIKISNNDKEHAYIIAKAMSEMAPAIVKNVKKPWIAEMQEGSDNASSDIQEQKEYAECISVLNHPKKATTHDSPSLVTNVALAAMVAAIAAYAIYFVIALMDTVIKTEDDLKKIAKKYPIIGVIPSWSEK